jgi:hypothetical protein
MSFSKRPLFFFLFKKDRSCSLAHAAAFYLSHAGLCAMCGKQILDTKNYKQSAK